MSSSHINEYYREVEKLKHFGGSSKETSIRNAFYNLLNDFAKTKDLSLVAEVSRVGKYGSNVTPDGTLKDFLRSDWGYWESKDEFDDIDKEIEKKFSKGYPNDNILFEDSKTAVLIQNGSEVKRVDMTDPDQLKTIITDFMEYEREEVSEFRKAIALFKQDIPKVTEALRDVILNEAEKNKNYLTKMEEFLELCLKAINPYVTKEDVREMVIQHILTADIFNTIFDDPYFHRENNIAQELENLTKTFFTNDVRKQTLAQIQHYYQAINAKAAQISDHHEKQKFLKVVYETFYKSYNPKKADRLGVVYTPNEIVKFMIESTDYLLNKHFGKFLEDKGVDILDPATGTGTFICDLIDHIRKDKLEYKYMHELHANEVEILPYYIANLNIEFTYKQKLGKYAEFKNLCFVDTLDNVGFSHTDYQPSFLDTLTKENTGRVQKQNERKISVIIGNPPYNANQMNENENNKNTYYKQIDKRIKDTYIKYSTAQKTKVYDMYARFYRWAMDRLQDNGIISFITNRSFIDSKTFDGFRKCIQFDFDYMYIVDTKSDVRLNPKISGTANNVFGIQTGVAIAFLVKKNPRVNDFCRIEYIAMDDFWKKDEKLQWLSQHKLENIPFMPLFPDKTNNWLNTIEESEWDDFVPVVSKETKLGKVKNGVIFELFSLGIVTARDEWVYDRDILNLNKKIKYFYQLYQQEMDRWQSTEHKSDIKDFVDREIKWTSELEEHMKKNTSLTFEEKRIRESLYRPFTDVFLYYDKIIDHRTYQQNLIFPISNILCENLVITFSGIASSKEFTTLASNKVFDFHFIGDSQCLPLYRYDSEGKKYDNITDWALKEYQKHYEDKSIVKEDIFHYVYGVLHNPEYRREYSNNLKKDFPRIPYYEDFGKWSGLGKELMELHLGYETITPYALEVNTTKKEHDRIPKAKLQADKMTGTIILDEETTIRGIPEEAWEYKLGNRSALEWILDQHKERKPKDPTIAEKFNNYKFADYKDKVIDLIGRITTVSVKTMRIIGKML